MPIVPQEMVTRIGRAHLAGQSVLVEAGMDAFESIDVALAVEAHRWFWMPERITTLLIAESHLFTSQDELGCKVKCSWLRIDGTSAPNSFVRSPYCVGYGEPDLVPGIPKEGNTGNWQYWDLFGELANIPEMAERRTSLVDRLSWKAKVLSTLRAQGVWMMDASLHGRSGRNAPETQLIPSFYRTWWEGYGRKVWEDEGQPRVVVVGKGLFRAVQEAGVPVNEWLYLPAGLREADQQAHQTETIRQIRRFMTAPNF